MTREAKTHIRDIRLFNNAGLSVPVCKATAPLLDLDSLAWEFSDNAKDATCKSCVARYPRRYPWTKQHTADRRLPIGCADRYNEIIQRAGYLGELFVNGNREIMLNQLLDMYPRTALAVLAVMMAHATTPFQENLRQFLLEVA